MVISTSRKGQHRNVIDLCRQLNTFEYRAYVFLPLQKLVLVTRLPLRPGPRVQRTFHVDQMPVSRVEPNYVEFAFKAPLWTPPYQD